MGNSATYNSFLLVLLQENNNFKTMKSRLQFFEFESGDASDCGNVLVIEKSSEKLGWQGVVLEKGTSPHFYPNNVYTPYFYFALSLIHI